MKYVRHKPKLNDIRIWIAISVLIAIPVIIGNYLETDILLITTFLVVSFFVLNLVLRKYLFFRNYFIHEYNLLTSKIRFEKTFDISKELMFEKLIEVIHDSKFKLIKADKDNYEILAISKISWLSWGENLYISFEDKGDESIMKFYSATLFQIYSWGKNKKNYDDLMIAIDSSLTV